MNNDYLNKIYQKVKGKNRKTIKTLHFSDPHVDPQYRIGADSQCTTYLCCREENGFPTEPERHAQQWGSYLCDLPKKTF